MVIEENENANYLAHYKTKGAKNGIRRFQSYLVQPNPSGATGQEIGEAAAQRGRITGKKNDSEDKTVYKSAKELRKEARRQQKLQKIAAKRKKKETDDKEKWSKSYRELAKHKDAFTNEELRRAIDRLELESRITSSSLNSVRDKTQKGADILKNLDSAGRSMAGIYNTLAGGWNAYHALTGKGKKLPTIGRGNESISINKNTKNQKNSNQKKSNNNDNDKKQQNNDLKANAAVFGDDHNRSAYEMYEWGKNRQKEDKKNHTGDSHLHRQWQTTSLPPVPYDWNQSGNDEITNLIEKLKDKRIRKVRHDDLESLGPYLEHYGKPGQKWYHRFFQSYKTAPTRSGKVGEEHGLASAQAERVGEEESNKSKPPAEHGPFIVMPKALGDAGFKDTTPAWYKKYDDTKNKRQYSKELDVEMNHNAAGIKKTNASISIDSDASQEAIDAAVKFAKDFKKHDAAMRDAITNEYFNNYDEQDVPWLYQKDPNDPPGSLSEKVSNMSSDQQKKFFKEHLGTACYDPSKTEKQFTTGHIDVMATYGDTIAEVYYSDGGAYWGHVFIVDVDLKTGKIGDISMGG